MLSIPIATKIAPIPNRVHMIWVGGSLPSWVSTAVDQMQDLCDAEGFEFSIWTDSTIKDTPMQRAYDLAERYDIEIRGYADLIRLSALSFMGGMYVDVDVTVLRPMQELINASKHGWICTEVGTEQVHAYCNAMIAAYPGHPVLSDLYTYAQKQLHRGIRNVHSVAGPQALYRTMRSTPRQIDVVYKMTMDSTIAERRARAAGGVDIERLRVRHAGMWAAHIDPEKSAL